MNRLHQLPRALAPILREALDSFPVVVLTGARQVGKSTLCRQVEPERTYRTLDDLETLDATNHEPDALVRSAERLTLDEVQRSPDLLRAIKRSVDEDRSPGRFLLTGSANLLLTQRIAETLAGRAAYLELWPLSRGELRGQAAAGRWSELFSNPVSEWPKLFESPISESSEREDWRDLAKKGGYPTPAYELQAERPRSLWFEGYVRTYLERDILELSSISSLVDFRRLMQALSLRLGSLVNQSEIARDLGMSQPTVHRHLGLLEISYQLVRVSSYRGNRTSRLVKTPKIYGADAGLSLHLSGEVEPRGAHLENLVLSDLLVWRSLETPSPSLLFWRTSNGVEVDFVLEQRNEIVGLEIKAADRAAFADAQGLRQLGEESGTKFRGGLVLHTGSEIRWLAERVLAVPWWRVF